MVKRLTDEDHRRNLPLRVVLLGSSALLMQRGLSESLAGRFELHRHPHWAFPECAKAFGLSLPEYVYFGGSPGALSLHRDDERWRGFVRDTLIETVLAKDVGLVAPVEKPVLLRQVFGLATSLPAEVVSYQKMVGTLPDAGNTTTVASYLKLLEQAFLLCPLERFSGARIKQRGSTPKLLGTRTRYRRGKRYQVPKGSVARHRFSAPLFSRRPLRRDPLLVVSGGCPTFSSVDQLC